MNEINNGQEKKPVTMLYTQSLESIIAENRQKENVGLYYPHDDEYVRLRRTERRQPFYIQKEKKKRNIVKNLKIAAIVSVIAGIVTGGYVLVDRIIKTHDIVDLNGFSITGRDIQVRTNRKKAGDIIDALMDNNYENIEYDDISYILQYIKDAELGNYDKNGTTIMFKLDEYFADKVFFSKNPNSSEQIDLLKKIEELYKACFEVVDGRVVLIPSASNRFISYILSLSFMYDTTVDLRGSGLVPMKNQFEGSPYASQKEVSYYQSFPAILKFIIENEALNMLQHSNYAVTYPPSNYHSDLDHDGKVDLDKSSLTNRLKEEMNLLITSMNDNVTFRESHK